MSELLPLQTSVGDLCKQALKESGAIGIGQTPTADDMNDAWTRLQWLLQQYQVQRFLNYHLNTWTVLSTGQVTPYTVGPGGQIDTTLAGVTTSRPNRIESAFFQQQLSPGNYGPIRYPVRLIPSMEDYSAIALPNLVTFSLAAFYDPSWARSGHLGGLYFYPWPNLNLYSLGIVVREQLPAAFPSLATVMVLPFEYFYALMTNLAVALRPKYGIGSFPGDTLPSAAKEGLRVLRAGNTAIKNLSMPAGLSRGGLYNIFSDQNY